MRGFLAPLFAKFHRGRAIGPASSAADRQTSAAETQLAARSLTTIIDRAMNLGQWEHAERIAHSAAGLAPESPRLSERLARLRLAQGRAETALAIIDSCRERTSSLRLLRAACLVRVGRREEAHSDLHQWSTLASAPLDSRLMLASLEWEAGDLHAAALALMRNLRHLEDPMSLMMLVLIAAAENHRDAAERWAARLREVTAFGAGPSYVDILCCSLGLPRPVEASKASDEQIGSLAMELMAAESAIPALVEAQRLRYQPQKAQLLADAIERALDDLTLPAHGCEALAELALLRGEPAAAARWTALGLALGGRSPVLRTPADRLVSGDHERADVLATIGAPDEAKERHRGRAA